MSIGSAVAVMAIVIISASVIIFFIVVGFLGLGRSFFLFRIAKIGMILRKPN